MGQEAIGKYLGAVRLLIDQKKVSLSGILVVTDADSDPSVQFNRMVRAMNKAKIAAPQKAFQVDGKPMKTGVFIIPGEGETGTLEHLLWNAAIKKTPSLKKCIANFCRCTGGHINSASPNMKAKMKMSAIVAAHCSENPWASAAGIWSEPGNPVPINSTCFDHISSFLVAFTT
jgi:hypothetical protein